MISSPLLRIALGLLLGNGLLFASGCANRGYQRAARTSATIDATANELDAARTQLAQAQQALQQLTNEPTEDLRPAFRQYAQAVGDLDDTAAALDRRTEELQQQRQAYLERWQEQNQAIQSDDVRERSLARQQEVTQQFTRLEESYAQTRETFAPLLVQLRDIQRLLAVDLTAAGIANARELADQTQQSIADARTALADLAERNREVSDTLDPRTLAVAE